MTSCCFFSIAFVCCLFLVVDATALDSKQTNWRDFISKSSPCAASESLHTEETGIMSYAVDIFGGEKLQADEKLLTFNCTTAESPIQFHQCSLGGAFCPVAKENIQDAVSAIEWKISSQVCRSIRAVESSEEKVTIYVLGGSVSMGRFSQGCCCNLDSNCPKYTQYADELDPELDNCLANDFEERSVGGCGWVKLFKLWIERKYSNVEVKSLARGGTTSVSMFLSEDSGVFGAPLGPNDIILIDYSVNDLSQYGGLIAPDDLGYKGVDVDLIAFGLQGLVRHFLDREQGLRPAVVIVESWPHGLWHDYSFDRPSHDRKDYSDSYRAVARHYGLPVWSYRDAVNSEYVERHQGHIKEWIRWGMEHLPMDALEHPHWHAHLFQADLMTGAFELMAAGCEETEREPALAQKLLHAPTDERTLREPMKLSASQLSSAACQAEKVGHRDESLHVDAAVEHSKANSGKEGDLFFKPRITEDGSTLRLGAEVGAYTDWHLSREKNNKVGWVSAYSEHENYKSEHLMVTHLNLSALQEDRNGLALKIQFLSSYENMGVLGVSLCGTSLGYVDGLWSDYNRTRFSLSRIALFSICAPCENPPCAPQLIYPHCPNWDHAALVFTHKYLGSNRYDHSLLTSIIAPRRVRRQQKFKILSINSCFVKEMCAFPTMVSLKII